MRKYLLLCVFAILISGLLQCQIFENENLWWVNKIYSPPIIDGEIDDCWYRAEGVSDFQLIKNYGLAKNHTNAYVLYDDETIYFLIISYDNQIENISAFDRKRDAETWYDDCIEIFLSPNQNSSYFHFILNFKNSKYDAYHSKNFRSRDMSWNGVWESAIGYYQDKWITEIGIPFSNFEIDPFNLPLSIWKVNICRQKWHDGIEQSTWHKTTRWFHEPWNFGQIIFGPKPMP